MLHFSSLNNHKSSYSILAFIKLSNDWSPENMTLMVPVRKEKNVSPTNSTHILKSNSFSVVPEISPYPTVVIVVRMK